MAASTEEKQAAYVQTNQLRYQFLDETAADNQVFTQFLAPVLKEILDQTTDKTEATGIQAHVDSAGLSLGSFNEVGLRQLDLQSWLSLAPPSLGLGKATNNSWLREEVIENLAILATGEATADVQLFVPSVLASQLGDHGAAERERLVKEIYQDIEKDGYNSEALYNTFVPELEATTKVLVLPLWANNHFSCAAIYLRQHRVVMYNSWHAGETQSNRSKKPREMLNCILILLRYKYPTANLQGQWTFATGSCLTQSNDYDCGVLTVDNIRHIMRGEAPRHTVPDITRHCVELRAQYLEELYEKWRSNVTPATRTPADPSITMPPAGDVGPSSRARASRSRTTTTAHAGPSTRPKAARMPADDGERPDLEMKDLIAMALRASPTGALDSAAIRKWIADHFSFYATYYRLENNVSTALTKNFVPGERSTTNRGRMWRFPPTLQEATSPAGRVRSASTSANIDEPARKRRNVESRTSRHVFRTEGSDLFAPQAIFPEQPQPPKLKVLRAFMNDVKSGNLKSRLPLQPYTLDKQSPTMILNGRALLGLVTKGAGRALLVARPTRFANDAVVGRLPKVQLAVATHNTVLRAFILNKGLATLGDEGDEIDVVHFWGVLLQASDRVSQQQVTIQEALDSQRAKNPDMAIRSCFHCVELCFLPDMHTLAGGQKICAKHIGEDIPELGVRAATKPIEDIVIHPGDHAWFRQTRLTIDKVTKFEGKSGGGKVSQGELFAFVRSFFNDPAGGLWWDPWVEEVRDLKKAVSSGAEQRAINQSHQVRDPVHPKRASLDCLDPILFLNDAMYKHCAQNATLMLYMFNRMKGTWSRMLLPLMGMAARQTRLERAKKNAGDAEWHDEAFWEWWHNAIAHVHFLNMTFPRKTVYRLGIPMPAKSRQTAFATAMKTGRYTEDALLVAPELARMRSIPHVALPDGLFFPQLEQDWFLEHFISLTDEIEDDTGIKVPRWGSTRFPWPFEKSQQPADESRPGQWWKGFMMTRFATSYRYCDKRNRKTLAQKESPLTWGLVYVVSWCETDGCDSFIFCQMSPYPKSPISASMARLSHVAAGTMMESGFTTPWPTSFKDHYIKAKRTVGPQPLAVNLLWYHAPHSMHTMMFDELCKIKEATAHCPAPAKDLEILQYPATIVLDQSDQERVSTLDEDHDELDEDFDKMEELDEDFLDEEDEEIQAVGQQETQAEKQETLTEPNAELSMVALATMRAIIEGLENELKLQGGFDHDGVQENLAFMWQALRDGDQNSFYTLRDRVADFQHSGRITTITDQLEHAAASLDVGIKHAVSELGPETLAATTFRILVTQKQASLRDAIAAKSLSQFNAKRKEVQSTFRGVIEELQRRKNVKGSTAGGSSQAHGLQRQSNEEEQRLATLKSQVTDAQQALKELNEERENARTTLDTIRAEAAHEKALAEESRKARERAAMEAERQGNQAHMAAIAGQLSVMKETLEKLQASMDAIAGQLSALEGTFKKLQARNAEIDAQLV